MSMTIVLNAIETYWKEENERKSDLAADQKENLRTLAAGCEGVLEELKELLDKHKSLASGESFIARMRWVPNDIAPIRNKLILQTTLLSTFNNVITATSSANAQAKLLEALNVIHRDYETGQRAAPAFSSVTVADLNTSGNVAWKEIEADIQSEHVPVDLVRQNQAFVRDWIEKVIIEEPEGMERDEAYNDSPPWPASATPPETSLTRLTLESPLQSPIASQQKRSASFSSHSSKDSAWRPVDGPNPDYVQGLLKKVLQLENSVLSDEIRVKRIAKRVYHQLDWTGRGFLYRFTVQDEFRKVLDLIDIDVSDSTLASLVSVGDKNKDGKIDLQECEDLLVSLISLVDKIAEQDLQARIKRDIKHGRRAVENLLQATYNQKKDQAPLLWGWQKSTSAGGWTFSFGLDKSINSKKLPIADTAAFCSQYLIATKMCIPALSQSLSHWGKRTEILRLQHYNLGSTTHMPESYSPNISCREPS
ncbi:uncharacterized protein BDZ99DRAFT_114426 [Mytilinidion resinicola]|uniref:EF-hand domain-containing protein n=1 Tax=Mytilinidion resinicola TaxID=574789 RepID=A0A6A6Y8K2_9PEZI|nr:uncharacterized protein BDZ99DRAFT_114426 [Mytilinidion resinicola]KAF2805161.1 hypothetical protein BDZ99DRAFT_114426 [Mytilinidion resinicola]